MSFFNNCKSEKIPGPIRNNPTNGICEKACIQVDKILDMCMKQEQLTDISIVMNNIMPSDLVPPFKFLSARTIGSEAQIDDLVVSDYADQSCDSRVSCTVLIPIQVIFSDANGKQGVATANISLPRDVILHTAAPSVMPFSIVADAAVVANKGTYVSENTFMISACSTVILKVLIKVNLLVPTYGYAYIPPCREYVEDECEEIFDIPLYPQECGVDPHCCSQLK